MSSTKAIPIVAGTLQTDPRSGGLKRSSGVNILPIVDETWAEVRDDRRVDVDWLIVGYDGNSKTDITLLCKGNGGIDTLSQYLPHGKAVFGGSRLQSNGRFVTFFYADDDTPTMQKGRASMHKNGVMNVLVGSDGEIEMRKGLTEEETDLPVSGGGNHPSASSSSSSSSRFGRTSQSKSTSSSLSNIVKETPVVRPVQTEPTKKEPLVTTINSNRSSGVDRWTKPTYSNSSSWRNRESMQSFRTDQTEVAVTQATSNTKPMLDGDVGQESNTAMSTKVGSTKRWQPTYSTSSSWRTIDTAQPTRSDKPEMIVNETAPNGSTTPTEDSFESAKVMNGSSYSNRWKPNYVTKSKPSTSWKKKKDSASIEDSSSMETPEDSSPVPDERDTANENAVPYEQLRDVPAGDLPPGVDPLNREKSLSDSEFITVFGMGKDEFSQLAGWKRKNLKKSKGLF